VEIRFLCRFIFYYKRIHTKRAL